METNTLQDLAVATNELRRQLNPLVKNIGAARIYLAAQKRPTVAAFRAARAELVVLLRTWGRHDLADAVNDLLWVEVDPAAAKEADQEEQKETELTQPGGR